MEATHRQAQRAALIAATVTAVVVAIKLYAANQSGSISVLGEALQSLVDVAISILTVIMIGLAAKPADEDHPWGHGKAEVLFSGVQMLIVIGTACVIAWQAALRFANPPEILAPIGIAAMSIAAVTNLAVITYIKRVAGRTGSAALRGEAEHLRGDLLASLGVLAGLIGYQMTGNRLVDPMIAILFVVLAIAFAVRQLNRVIHDLMDGALPPEEVQHVEDALNSHARVKGFHKLQTRRAGSLRIVSLHILLEDSLTFVEAHDLAEDVEQHLSEVLGGAQVTAHFEPYEAEMAHRRSAHHDH
ncbi:cation diffusion facilitator family transporter [Kamptonema cortianum]|nr:cation diffusion facilitator family transporter [Geitlerinema splendidum]MDK3162430.1 cation diffusion facilitator family transporter [Kamptonema cortianum]